MPIHVKSYFEVSSTWEIASDVQRATVTAESDRQRATEHQISWCKHTKICGQRFSVEGNLLLAADCFEYTDLYTVRGRLNNNGVMISFKHIKTNFSKKVSV